MILMKLQIMLVCSPVRVSLRFSLGFIFHSDEISIDVKTGLVTRHKNEKFVILFYYHNNIIDMIIIVITNIDLFLISLK